MKYDTNLKMNPPLREAADRDAMLEGIADGTVDVIATDHAPHHVDEKMVEFDRAPFGIVGLETAVPLVFDRLVHTGRISLVRDDRAAVGEPGAPPQPARRDAERRARRPTSPMLAPDLPVTIDAAALRVEIEEHAVRRLAAAGRRRRTIVGGGGVRSRCRPEAMNEVNSSDDLRRQALKKLEELEVLMRDGHFDYGNGYHGRVYLNPHQLFLYPSTIWRLAQDLLDVLPAELLARTEVVAGPATGGALLAHTIAGLLDGRRGADASALQLRAVHARGRRVRAAELLRARIDGQRVLLADDVRNTGKTFQRCAELVTAGRRHGDRDRRDLRSHGSDRRSRRAELRAGRVPGAGELRRGGMSDVRRGRADHQFLSEEPVTNPEGAPH